jgi:hypothetical protein
MTEPTQQHLRDRAAAVGVEIHELRRQAALANDVVTLVPLKEADRALKRAFGRGDHDPGDSYIDLKERIAEELFSAADSEERVVKARKESLRAAVRSAVEAELGAERAQLDATAAVLEDRAEAVGERERQARPSYRARFVAVGAFVALSADLLIRTVP